MRAIPRSGRSPVIARMSRSKRLLADGFAEVRLPGATLAISAEPLIQRFNAAAATASANGSAILEFEVDDNARPE